jgi:hypothetical protein
MGGATGPAGPKGLFRRETKGAITGPATVQIERGRIRFFAQVLGETSPLYTDVDAARSAGHPDLAAPPSFFMVIEALANAQIQQRGCQSAFDLVGCDMRYLLHGDEHYAYDGLIYAGDEVSMTTAVVDFYDKKGGTMEFVILESQIAHPDRGVLVRARRTLLHKLG